MCDNDKTGRRRARAGAGGVAVRKLGLEWMNVQQQSRIQVAFAYCDSLDASQQMGYSSGQQPLIYRLQCHVFVMPAGKTQAENVS